MLHSSSSSSHGCLRHTRSASLPVIPFQINGRLDEYGIVVFVHVKWGASSLVPGTDFLAVMVVPVNLICRPIATGDTSGFLQQNRSRAAWTVAFFWWKAVSYQDIFSALQLSYRAVLACMHVPFELCIASDILNSLAIAWLSIVSVSVRHSAREFKGVEMLNKRCSEEIAVGERRCKRWKMGEEKVHRSDTVWENTKELWDPAFPEDIVRVRLPGKWKDMEVAPDVQQPQVLGKCRGSSRMCTRSNISEVDDRSQDVDICSKRGDKVRWVEVASNKPSPSPAFLTMSPTLLGRCDCTDQVSHIARRNNRSGESRDYDRTHPLL